MLRRMIRRLKKDNDFYTLFSPNFYKLENDEKHYLFGKFNILKQNGITVQDISKASEDLDNLQADKIKEDLDIVIDYILKSQKKDGSWSVITTDNLIQFDSIIYGNHFYKIKEYEEHINDNKISNAWTNSILTLILNKWLTVLENLTIGPSEKIKEIEKSILSSVNWLNKNRNISGDIYGFGPFLPNIDKNLINVYDTSFAYISQLYNNKNADQLISRNEFRKIYKNLVSEKILNDEVGAWYKDNLSSNRVPDVGASSYAISLFIKAAENGYEIDENLSAKSVGWISSQQNSDGGWAVKKGEKSATDITCLAIMALQKYVEYSGEYIRFDEVINSGVKFIENSLEEFNCPGKDGGMLNLYCWPRDGLSVQEICFKNSSLAISTLLKCDIPIFKGSIRRSVSSLIRIYKQNHEGNAIQPVANIEEAYFICMLADYLKAWMDV